MANTNETIADIIAWLRRPREGENAYLTLWRDEIADRLEAARKREKAAIEADALAVGGIVEASRATTEKSSAVGNAAHKRKLSKNTSKNGVDFGQLGDAAKLREALEMARPFVKGSRYDIMITSGEHKGIVLKPKDTLALVDAALAAPPRNCDVYNADELKVMFNSELVLELPIANEHEKNLVTITAMGVIDTLLAHATEKEGGAI